MGPQVTTSRRKGELGDLKFPHPVVQEIGELKFPLPILLLPVPALSLASSNLILLLL